MAIGNNYHGQNNSYYPVPIISGHPEHCDFFAVLRMAFKFDHTALDYLIIISKLLYWDNLTEVSCENNPVTK